MHSIHLVAAIALIGFGSAAVSAEEVTAGTRMAAEARLAGDLADDKEALAAQWKKGERMEGEGEKLLRRSESRLLKLSRDAKRFQSRADQAISARAKEEASLARGQRMVEEGRNLQLQAEAGFRPSST